jgi:CRP-like cAMP-binding protein
MHPPTDARTGYNPSPVEHADRLLQFEVFSHLSDQQIRAIADRTAEITYPDGTTVFEEGDDSREAYLVCEGMVKIERRTPYGSFTLAELGPGELFGESSFLDGKARSGCCQMIAAGSLIPLNPTALEPLLSQDKRLTMAIYWAFWKSLSKKLRSTNDQLTRFFSRTVPSAEPNAGASGSSDSVHIGLDAKRSLFREQKLSPMEINFLASLSQAEKLRAGEVLFSEGMPGDHMYVVLEGRMLISKQIPGAGEEALAILERGDYFGEMALIDRQPRSADARAHDGAAVVLGISREVLEGILDIQRVSSLRLLHLLCLLICKRLREIDNKLIGWYIFDAGSGESLDAPEPIPRTPTPSPSGG